MASVDDTIRAAEGAAARHREQARRITASVPVRALRFSRVFGTEVPVLVLASGGYATIWPGRVTFYGPQGIRSAEQSLPEDLLSRLQRLGSKSHGEIGVITFDDSPAEEPARRATRSESPSALCPSCRIALPATGMCDECDEPS